MQIYSKETDPPTPTSLPLKAIDWNILNIKKTEAHVFKRSFIPLISIILITVLVALFNAPIMATLWRYSLDDGTYSHAYLIPFIVLYLYYTLFDNYAADEVNLNFKNTPTAADDGSLFKINASYQFSDDVMAYATISEGFRVGGANSVAACPEDVASSDIQNICALPDETLYQADTTTNYELGFKSTWFNNKFHFNAALFTVEWDNAQVAGATFCGQQSITSNAATAEAKGVEISTRAMLSDSLTAYATYAYTNAELTKDAPFLFKVLNQNELDKFFSQS